MNSELLHRWLNLPNAVWPPDAHTLLGVKPGQCDLCQLEHCVQERLAKLRCYQISHPDEATEGMNRLAQAFVTVMEEAASQSTLARVDLLPPEPTLSEDAETMVEPENRLDWQSGPPPVRRPESVVTFEVIPPPPVSVNGTKTIPTARPAAVTNANTQMILDLAHRSAEARGGLGTLPALIQRIDLTRRLLIAWNHAGTMIRDPKRKLAKTKEEIELTRRLADIATEMQHFPGILGQPGLPGYRVAAMARLQLNSLMFKAMDAPQREMLAIDWVNGRKVLLAYRQFLKQTFKKMRRRGPITLALHALRAFVNDHPWIMASAVILMAGVAAWMWWK